LNKRSAWQVFIAATPTVNGRSGHRLAPKRADRFATGQQFTEEQTLLIGLTMMRVVRLNLEALMFVMGSAKLLEPEL
jgi:hypothetical protein